MESTELAVMSEPQVQPQTVHLVARNPNEMATSRQSLLLWLTNKIASSGSYTDPKTVSFLIAWHLDLRTL